MHDYPRRLRKLRRVLRPAGLDALLITRPVHVRYLTGFTGDSSFLLVMPGRAVLFSDSRFEIQIAEECAGLEADIRGPDRNTWQSSTEAVNRLGLRAVGFEGDHVTVAALGWLRELSKSVDWSPQYGHVERLRAVKDASEVRAIRAAIRTSERAFAMLRATLTGADTEKQAADAVDAFVRRAGGDGVAFDTIAAVGDRSALPHAPPSQRRVGESPFLLLDWGARRDGYVSDTTRVLPTGEESSGVRRREWARLESRLRPLYITVLAAQRAAAAVARDGVAVRDVDAAARAVIAEAGHAERFNHGLGHGIGLEVHEAPAVRSNSDDVLKAGMVITLEPGVYFPGFAGVRIEDDFLLVADGCERLTALPQDWDEFF